MTFGTLALGRYKIVEHEGSIRILIGDAFFPDHFVDRQAAVDFLVSKQPNLVRSKESP